MADQQGEFVVTLIGMNNEILKQIVLKLPPGTQWDTETNGGQDAHLIDYISKGHGPQVVAAVQINQRNVDVQE